MRLKLAGVTLIDVGIGIRSAYLNWTLSNCLLPEGEWALNPRIESAVNVQRQITDAVHSVGQDTLGKKSFSEVGGQLALAVPTTRAKSRSEHQSLRKAEKREAHEIKDTFEQVVCTVLARGTSSLPSWQLEVPPGHSMLRGTLLDDQRFALAIVTGLSPSVQVSLEVPRHGYVLRAEGGELARKTNKWGLTRLLIQKHLLSKPRKIAEVSLEGEE